MNAHRLIAPLVFVIAPILARADAPAAATHNALAEHLPPAHRASAPADGSAPNHLRAQRGALVEALCRAAGAQPDPFAVAVLLGATAAKALTFRGSAGVAFDIADDPWFRDGFVAAVLGPGGKGSVIIAGLSPGKDRPGLALDVPADQVRAVIGEPKALAVRNGDGLAFKKLALLAMPGSMQVFKTKITDDGHIEEEAVDEHRASKPKMDPDWMERIEDVYYDVKFKGGPTCRVVVSTFEPISARVESHLARIQIFYPLVPLPRPDRPRSIE